MKTVDEFPVGTGIRSTLISWVTVERGMDTAPAKEVPLVQMPVLDVESMPKRGITLCYGRTDAPTVLKCQIERTEADGTTLYEVQVRVDITAQQSPVGLTREYLDADRAVPGARKRFHVVNLPRAKNDADDYLRSLIAEQVAAIEARDPEMVDVRLSKVIRRYPALLDDLSQHPEMAHVIMFIWEADLPGTDDDERNRIRQAKVATLYRTERILEIATINSDWVHAVLPELEVVDLRVLSGPTARGGMSL